MQIDPTAIKTVYSGRPGCGCGCRGKYFTDQRNITRVVRAINKALGADSQDWLRTGVDDNAEGQVFFAENETRYFWAYTYTAAE